MSAEIQRVYIASAQAEIIERIVLAKSYFCPVGQSSDGRKAAGEIRRLSPDLLILDSALTGLDGLALIDELGNSMLTPPRMLFLLPMQSETWLHMAREKGADLAENLPENLEMLIPRLEKLSDMPLARLSGKTEEMRISLAGELLDELGVPTALKGRRYMLFGAAYVACAPHLANAYSRKMYPLLGDKFSATPQAVERAIRTAIENTWLHGNLPAIQRLFGFSVDAERGKPTNAEFISMLAEHVRREGEKQLLQAQTVR